MTLESIYVDGNIMQLTSFNLQADTAFTCIHQQVLLKRQGKISWDYCVKLNQLWFLISLIQFMRNILMNEKKSKAWDADKIIKTHECVLFQLNVNKQSLFICELIQNKVSSCEIWKIF